MKIPVFKIDGAHTLPDIKMEGEQLTLPNVNYDYRYGMWYKHMLYVSKDLKEWCLAFRVIIDGVGYGIADLEQVKWVPEEDKHDCND